MEEKNSLDQEDLQRLREFEDKILSLQEEGAPKYSIDYQMESQIKYDVLIDHFGVDFVPEALESFGVSVEDLADSKVYLDIYNCLKLKKERQIK